MKGDERERHRREYTVSINQEDIKMTKRIIAEVMAIGMMATSQIYKTTVNKDVTVAVSLGTNWQ